MNLDRAPREIPCDRNPDRYVVANNENMKKLSTNDQKWLCHRLFKQALSLDSRFLVFRFLIFDWQLQGVVCIIR